MLNIEVEQQILGALMVDQSCYPVVMGKVSAQDFGSQDHREIFSAIEHLGRQIKMVCASSVIEELRNRNVLNNVGGVSYIHTIAFECYSTASLEAHLAILREYADRRILVDACKLSVSNSKTEQAPQIAARMETALNSIQRGGGAKHISEFMQPFEERLNHARAARMSGGVVGVPSGLPALDQRIGGFSGGRLYVIAGRPGVGKSALINQIAFRAAERQMPGVVFSLEMDATELMVRAAASRSRSNVSRIFRGAPEECEIAFGEITKVCGLPLWLADDVFNIDSIIAAIVMLKRRHSVKYAVVDHIGLCHAPGYQTRVEQLDAVTRKLKLAAKETGVAVIASSQMNRMVERDKRRPVLSDLRDSGGIEQNADACLFLHSEADGCPIPVEFGLLKNRNGPKGWLEEKIMFDGKTQTFTEIALADLTETG